MVNINFPLMGNNNRFSSAGMPSGRLGPRSSGAFLILFGIIFSGIGGFILYDNEQTKDWPTTTGTVAEVSSRVDYDSDGNSKTEYSYTLNYTIKDKSYSKRETSSSYVNNGQQKQLAYNTSNPGDVRVRSDGPAWVSWIFVLVGVVVAGLGIGTLIKGGSNGASSPVMPDLASPMSSPSIAPVQPPVAGTQPPLSGENPQQNGPFPPSTPPIS